MNTFCSLLAAGLLLSGLSACRPVAPDELVGTYVYSYTDLTHDTLFIQANGAYQQRIYSARTRELLYQNRGQWRLIDETLMFTDFMLNQHADIEKDGFNQMNAGLPVQRSLGSTLRIEEGETQLGGEGNFIKVD